MNPVYYLCYSDNSEKTGLVFPYELLPKTYSPGLWAIDLNQHDIIPSSFSFDAVDDNRLVTFKLTQVNGSVFRVNTKKYGVFYFRIINIYFRYQKYTGNSPLINPNNRLFQVISTDILKLNQICIERKFFFVGKVDKKTNH